MVPHAGSCRARPRHPLCWDSSTARRAAVLTGPPRADYRKRRAPASSRAARRAVPRLDGSTHPPHLPRRRAFNASPARVRRTRVASTAPITETDGASRRFESKYRGSRGSPLRRVKRHSRANDCGLSTQLLEAYDSSHLGIPAKEGPILSGVLCCFDGSLIFCWLCRDVPARWRRSCSSSGACSCMVVAHPARSRRRLLFL